MLTQKEEAKLNQVLDDIELIRDNHIKSVFLESIRKVESERKSKLQFLNSINRDIKWCEKFLSERRI